MRVVKAALVRLRLIRTLQVVVALLLGASASAQELGVGEVWRIATRAGVSVPTYAYWQDRAVATVVLFSGGAGGYGRIAADGWPDSGNFLIRSGKRWAMHPFNVVMIGRPSDGIDLGLGNVRIGPEHAADNAAILQAIKARSALPIWLVGTSMGTISATAASIADGGALVAGLVLTSSVVAYKIPGAVPRQDLGAIRVPTLVLHHAQDACAVCRPYEVDNIGPALSHAPVVRTVFVNGGEGASGDPCQAMHHHGFIGMENEAVDLVAAWILHPAK